MLLFLASPQPDQVLRKCRVLLICSCRSNVTDFMNGRGDSSCFHGCFSSFEGYSEHSDCNLSVAYVSCWRMSEIRWRPLGCDYHSFAFVANADIWGSLHVRAYLTKKRFFLNREGVLYEKPLILNGKWPLFLVFWDMNSSIQMLFRAAYLWSKLGLLDWYKLVSEMCVNILTICKKINENLLSDDLLVIFIIRVVKYIVSGENIL